MIRSDLFKLSMTLVLLVATAFVSVAAVAAEGSDTIRLVKPAPASLALGGRADDWYRQARSPAIASGAVVVSDWFERHPDSIHSAGAVVVSDWFERHPESINLGASAGAQMHYGPPGR